jgi:hypothetical protein
MTTVENVNGKFRVERQTPDDMFRPGMKRKPHRRFGRESRLAMRSRQSRLVRAVLIGLLTFPLLGTGACLEIMQNAVIHGFFDTATPLLLDYVESQLASDGGSDGSANESDGS